MSWRYRPESSAACRPGPASRPGLLPPWRIAGLPALQALLRRAAGGGTRGPLRLASAAVVLAAASSAQAQAQGPAVYRCPGNPVLYTDALSPQEARERGCTTLEGTPITVFQARPRPPAPAAPAGAAAAATAPAAGPAARGADARVDPAEQRARDRDARRILEAELRREEDRLAELRREFNNGQPERRGDERNFERYLERVASLRAALARTEADVAALRRELAKLPPS